MLLSVIILAAGKGKRMASNLPKVMHQLGGLPLLERVVNTAKKLSPSLINVVYGNGGSRVREACDYLPVSWSEQPQQFGTGHAVMTALPNCLEKGRVLVLYGDVPLISAQTLKQLLDETPKDSLGLLVAKLKDPTGLGRIIRDDDGKILEIVEHKDASEAQLAIDEINTGIMVCPVEFLKGWLPKLKNNNHQGEYYLTDVVALAVEEGIPVNGVVASCPEETKGVNDLWQLANLERSFQRRQAKQFTLAGVTIRDPERVDFRGDDIQMSKDVTLDINVVLEGTIRIGEGSHIGPGVVLKDVSIGENVCIEANSIIEGAVIGDHCHVGPFARLRPGSILEEKAKVGNFVEMKKSILGPGSKANHLSYLGDAIIGSDVNIGAGTITCNYDGANKWETIIQDNAFIGSNSSLVAPVVIGENATVGAGSTISQDAPNDLLTVSRAPQRSVEGWQRPEKPATKQTDNGSGEVYSSETETLITEEGAENFWMDVGVEIPAKKPEDA